MRMNIIDYFLPVSVMYFNKIYDEDRFHRSFLILRNFIMTIAIIPYLFKLQGFYNTVANILAWYIEFLA